VVLGWVLVAVVLLACGAHGQTALGSWKTGRSTFYTDIDQGNCGFGALSSTKFPYRYIAGTQPHTLRPCDGRVLTSSCDAHISGQHGLLRQLGGVRPVL
jgi:hypothetical protein